MVVQHILCSRIGKREVKPVVPEVKTETSTEKNDSSVTDSKTKEGENESKEEIFEKESVSETSNKDEDDIETSEDKNISDTKDKSKSEETVTESKQENAAADVKPQIIEVEEYFVKYRNFSYLHCEWRTEEELYKGDKRIQAKLKRFKQRQQQNTNIFENVIILYSFDITIVS